MSSWLPALNRVEEKLLSGASVADTGCGHPASTIAMTKAYPGSQFVGFDYHAASVEAARRAAERAGVADRVRFEAAASTLICTPASRAQEVGLVLGAQAGEARLRALVTDAGFTRIWRTTESPFDLVLEARP